MGGLLRAILCSLRAFQSIEHLYGLMGRVSLDDGGEAARICSDNGLELAQGFRLTLGRALESLKRLP